MTRTLLFSIVMFVIFHSFNRCANPSSPTGGPRDTIPPSWLSSDPTHESLRFKENVLELTFSEFINADRLKSALVITPLTEINYSYVIKKNRIIIKLDDFLEDSTTYTFNFFNGITDITEKNPVENLILAFSTGEFIDSLSVYGSVRDLMTREPIKGVLVGLYLKSDSLDYSIQKPRYFTTTLEDGTFSLNNLKNDSYRLFTFKDENGNALFDPAKESYGFLARDIYLDQDLDSIDMFLQLLDISTFRHISSRPFGRTFDMRYSKEIKNYEVEALLSSDSFPSSILSDDKTTIKFYNNLNISYADSLGVIVRSYDTVKYELIDTAFVRFLESSRKPDDFVQVPSYQINPSGIVSGYITFSKPVSDFFPNQFIFQADTMYSKPVLNDSNYQWNVNRTQISFSTTFNWKEYNDSLNNYYFSHIMDTLPDTDTTYSYAEKTFRVVNLVSQPGTFISVEKDTSSILVNKLTKISNEDLGVLQIMIETNYQSFAVEVYNSKKKVVRRYHNEKNRILKNMSPGTYTLKVFIDENEDGIWSPALLDKDIPAELIYIYPNTTELRANWEVTIDDVTF